MGKLYYDMGLLSTDEVVECTTSNLIGQYVGQTSPKTKNQLEQALGKVLFIDEAYRLAEPEAQYAAEAVNELISLLSTPKFEGKMIVILAGYTSDMNKLMTVRPGLSSLFPEEIVFQNIDPDDCLLLLERELRNRQISAPILTNPDSAEYQKLKRAVKALQSFPSWSNARQIRIMAREMCSCAFEEEFASKRFDSLVDSEHIQEKTVPLSMEQALECLRKMFVVEYERWSAKEENPITKAPAPKGRKRTHAQAAEQPAEMPATNKKGKNLFLTIQINSMY
jgi:hypothetical protein